MHQWLSPEIVEILKATWVSAETSPASLEQITAVSQMEVTEELLAECERAGYLTRRNGSQIQLTQLGREQVEEVIRRHRLAERLVVDVLAMSLEDSEAEACEFEHVLAQGVTEAICTLLGHPRFCPHQQPIPAGACCRRAERQVNSLVVSVDRLDTGRPARIAYLSAAHFSRMQKLAAFGLVPGAEITVLQKSPSFVIRCEETQIAVEHDIARDIYVWG